MNMPDKKKEERKPHQEKFDTYKKHADIIDKFTDNLEIKYHSAIEKSLLKKGKAWVDKDGKYDRKVIAKADKKVLDDLTDTIMKDIIAHANPIFEEMYNIKLPDFKDNPFAKDFYQQLVGINREELFNVIKTNKKNFTPGIYSKINDSYVAKVKSRLDQAAISHIDHEEHLEDYLKEYKLQDYINKDKLASLKTSPEGRILMKELLQHVRRGGATDYTFLEKTANEAVEKYEGINLRQYLNDYNTPKKKDVKKAA